MSERYDDMREGGNVIERERRDFSAPLGDAAHGRLVFTSGAANVEVRAAAEISDLFRAHFEGVIPDVEARDGAVRIRYPHFAPFSWVRYAFQWGRLSADVTLNAAIPWRIEIRGGAARLHGDLSALQMEALDVGGGASQVELTLPPPVGLVPIRIGGGASHLILHRPKGAAARVRVGGGIAKLDFDEQHFGAIGGATRMETTGYADAADRYDIEIAGGAAHLTVDIR
jgi:hypothetical protein